MTVLELSGEQAAALRAKAAAQARTLQAWLQKLAAVEAPVHPHKDLYSLSELIAQCDVNAPFSGEDRAWLDASAIGREIWRQGKK